MNEFSAPPENNVSAEDMPTNSAPVSAVVQRELLLAQRKRRGRNRLLLALLALPLFILLLGLAFTATRAVVVVVLPEEAGLGASLDLQQGVGAVVSGKLYLLTGNARLTVNSPTYISQELDVAPDSVGSYVEVTLAPQPATVAFTLTPPASATDAHLEDTRWLLNDELVATGASYDSELEADQYELQIDHPFYELEQRTLTLGRGETESQAVALTPVNGMLEIDSTPRGAKVLLNDAPSGVSALRLELTGGEHDLVLRLKDHGTITETIRIDRKNRAVERNYRMLINAANLDVKVSPAGGTLRLNGTVKSANTNLVVNAKNEQVVTYQKPGYHSHTERVTLNPGETEQLNIALRENIGEVEIRSEPVATITINGRPAGNSPLTLSLPAVPQQITLSKPGYHPETRTIQPSDEAPKLIAVNLRTELDHRLQSMPREFDNQAGIRMLRFQPNTTFQMGAPRSELGQRANETLREVRLTRPFYVSQTEVTNAQFSGFSSGAAEATANPNFPRVNLSWQQAAAYCNWLSEKEGLTPVYQFSGTRYLSANTNADGYRLLSEAEWEWLARKAGRRNLNRFTWGDEYSVPNGAGNLADESAKAQVSQFIPAYTDGFPGIAPVKSFGLDQAQLADMSGNVSEWVHDFYQITPANSDRQATDPTGPQFGEGHVTKGSSWRSGTASTLRASYREPASQGRDDLGFRVARYIHGGQ